VLAYWRERLPLRMFGPVAAAIACPAQVPAFRGLGAFATDSAIAWLLLAQFRLWDDLADRDRDRKRHPHRVLARTTHAGRYVLLCVALAFVNTLVLSFRDGAALTLPLLAGLTLVLAVAYMQRDRSTTVDLLRLVKYPVFVLLIASSHAAGPALAAYAGAIAAFLGAVTYEVWHDPDARLRATYRTWHVARDKSHVARNWSSR
jgi:hypothetical protein